MASLFSKIVAGGLSAGVFLLWWPRHFPDQGLEWLVLRGVLWTLSFELLHVAIAPLERKALGPATQWLTARRPRRAGWVYASAALALLVPLALLTDVEPRPAAASAKPKVIKQVIVKRQRIVKREVVVQQVPSPAPAPRVPDPVVIVKKVQAPRPAPKPEPVVEADVTPEVEAPAATTGSSSGSSPRR
jgi:hypothetical protein